MASRRPAGAPRRSLWARLLRRAPEPDAQPEPAAAPAGDDEAAARVLTECLDALGSARHRPFSRV